MLPASELRIGNKIKSIFGNVETVSSIIDNTNRGKIKVCADCPDNIPHFKSEQHRLMYSHLILVEENGNQYKPCEIEGEPITKEWLDNPKNGFINIFGSWEKLDNRDFMLERTFSMSKHVGFNAVTITTGEKFVPVFKYIHELQNFYFAKTKKELLFV